MPSAPANVNPVVPAPDRIQYFVLELLKTRLLSMGAAPFRATNAVPLVAVDPKVAVSPA